MATKKAAKKTPAKSAKKAPAKKAAAKKAGKAPAPAATKTAGGLDFNHAMIYARDVERSIDFYRGLLGFQVIETFKFEGKAVYARLKAPAGEGTIALHQANPGANISSEGVRLYFEIRDVDEFYEKLKRRGVYFTQPPRMMPWGWRHAYLDDPDAHEISLYWAGAKRMEKTVMAAAKEAAKTPKAKRPE